MSCDSLAPQAITKFGAGFSADVQAQLQAAYDLPPKLRPGEKGPALRLQGKALAQRLKAAGVELPDHLDLDKPTSKAAIRLGRLAVALTEAKNRARAARQPREPQTFETLTAALESLPPDMPMMDLPATKMPPPIVPAAELAGRARRQNGGGPYEVRDETYNYGCYRRTAIIYVGSREHLVIYRESTD